MCLLSFSIPAIIKQKEKKLKEIKQSLKSQINCEASKNYEVKLRESQETNRERERERKQSFPPKLTDNSLTNSLPRTTAFCLYITQLIKYNDTVQKFSCCSVLEIQKLAIGGALFYLQPQPYISQQKQSQFSSIKPHMSAKLQVNDIDSQASYI